MSPRLTTYTFGASARTLGGGLFANAVDGTAASPKPAHNTMAGNNPNTDEDGLVAIGVDPTRTKDLLNSDVLIIISLISWEARSGYTAGRDASPRLGLQ